VLRDRASLKTTADRVAYARGAFAAPGAAAAR